MKKIFAYLLALCMVLGMLPATALASEGENTLLNNNETTQTGSINMGDTVVEGDGLTLSNTSTAIATIGTVEELKAFRDAVNGGTTYEGVTVTLTADLNLPGTEWTPIGNGTRASKSYTGTAFKGTFDGANHTISGLTITSTDGADAALGLFGVVDGGTVKDLNLTNVSINVPTSNLLGGAIGCLLNGGTAENITVSGAVTGYDGVGGIVGRMVISGTVSNCTNNASVTSSYGGIGGIVGKAYYEDSANTALFASISNCTNNGTITAPMYVGGIVGLARSNVTNCTNNGAVVGGTQTGGIVGQLIAAGTVSGNENKAKISGKNHMGGIIGDYTQSSSYSYYNVTIANNTNSGELAATEQCAAIMGCNNIDGFTAMTASGNVSYYYVDNLELFGNPEDMVIDDTNVFAAVAEVGGGDKYPTLAKAVAAIEGSGEITLLGDVTLTEGITIPADKTVTLDLNGCTVTSAVSTIVVDGGELTVIDSSDPAAGKIITTDTTGDYEAIAVKNGGKLTLEGGNVGSGCYGIYAYSSGGTIVMNGGTITLSGENKDGMAIAVGSAAGSATISNGKITANGVNWPMYTWGGAISITGGVFGFAPDTGYIASGYGLQENNDGTYSIVEIDPVAYIDGTPYYTIVAAIEEAQPGNTVMVKTFTHNGDLTVNKDITVEAAEDAVVTINGQLRITADGATVKGLKVVSGGTACYVNAKDVLIENCEITGSQGLYQSYTSGKVTFKNSKIIATYSYAINFDGSAGGEIVIENCTVSGWTSFAASIKKVTVTNTTFAENENYNYIRFYQENVVIDNCTFNEKMKIDLAVDGARITVTNSTLENGNVENLFSDEDIIDYSITVDGVKLVRVATITDAENKKTYYATLAEAVAAVANNGTIVLLDNNAENITVSKAVVFTLDVTTNEYKFTGSITADTGYTVTSNENVYTVTINQYTITFDTDGGSTIDAITQDYGTAVEAPANPTKTGYTFAGWDVTIPENMPAENVTITAQWTVNQYTITFEGADIAPITQDYGTAVVAPDAPTKTGYTFAGWDVEIPATMPAGNVTITAQWTVNQYTITFEGADIAPITQDYGSAVSAPSAPTKEGHTFAGWSPAIPETMPVDGLTVTAQWNVNQYTITFMSRGSVYEAITQDYGTSVQAPSDPTRSGYTFIGWDTAIPSTMPAEDMTITAKWSKNYVPPTTTTEKTENEDGSTTTTVTNNKTGTTTSTTENTDGSTTVTETKKDGTSTSTTTGSNTTTGEDGTTTKTDSTVTESVSKDGTTTKTEEKSETTEAADGSTTKTETKAETVTGTDGSVTATETKTETTEAADGSTTKTETKAETVTGTDGTETKTETKTETTQNADGTTSTATTETKTETKTEEDGSVVSTETKTETTENADGTTSTATTETKTTSATTTDETTGATVTETKVETKVESEEKTVTSTATETKTEATDGTTETVKVEETVEQTAEATTTTKTTATTTATEEKTETVAVKEETVTKEDGTTETKTTTTTETALADGTTATATTDESGKTEASVTVSEQAAAAAVETGAAVTLPIPAVNTTVESEAAATVTVTTNSTENTKVEIPVAEVSTSTVAVIVNEDGTETVVTETKMTENGLVVDVPDGATVKIVDNSTNFDDVEDEDWEKDAVDFASARGLVNGMGNNQFDLDSTATRAQVVTLLARLSGVDTTPGEGEKWYDKAQEWAVANGITYAGGMNNTITRHEMMTLLWRFVGSPKSEQDLSDFADADELNAVTTPAARWAVEIGLVQGNGNGTMTPTGSVTRGQLAQFLMNFVQKT